MGRVDRSPHLGRNLTFGLLDALGRGVIDGDYEKGGFPTEADLARRHGVSRSVAREANKMLAAKGLLRARRRQGTFVLPHRHWNLLDPDVLRWMREGRQSPDLVRSFTELRLSIEPHAAGLAVLRAVPDKLRAIAVALEEMRGGRLASERGLAAEIAFHGAVLAASDNPFFRHLDEMVQTGVRVIRSLVGDADPSGSAIDHYAAIEAAIARGDAAGAHDAMHDHIGCLLRRLDRA